jgi:transcriptional regulator with PAS, ATPase and Fis domain
MEHRAKITRKDDHGYGLIFHDPGIALKARLWKYIADNIVASDECPFCGTTYTVLPKLCKNCGWDLVFDRQNYFEYRERTAVFKRLEMKVGGLHAEQLQKLINFVDADLLRAPGSEEMHEFVGTSATMLQMFSKIRKVAKTDLSVLILGESGTGKELTALAIHERSPRKNKPFVTINCAAIPENLLEAELFGYEKGSFTGAYTSKKGKMESADGGTIFLDEIGEMPMNLQAKLLRFLQDRVVERIGSTSGRKVNIRVIAATNCDLNLAQDEGRFRSDLYFRLDEFTIGLPPVRERGEDVIILARFFLNKFSKEMGLTKAFTRKSVDAIEAYSWPGNVREMINKIRRAIVMSDGSTINTADLSLDGPRIARASEVLPLKEEVNQIEAQKVKEILSLCGNNISKAAKLLKLSRPSLYSRIKKYNIDTSVSHKQLHSR